MDSDHCPLYIKALLKSYKDTYDQKQQTQPRFVKTKPVQNNLNTPLCSQQSSQYSVNSQNNSQSLSSGLDLASAMLKDIVEENGDYIPVTDDEPLPDGGPNHDWHIAGNHDFFASCKCEPTCSIPTNCHELFSETEKSAEKQSVAYYNSLNIPEINVLLANEKQRVIIYKVMKFLVKLFKNELTDNEKENPLRMLIQGPAGTGKTFVIKAIVRETRRLFKLNKSVLNLAPTGAASVLLPDGKTIHQIARPPMFKKKGASLSDNPSSDKNLKKLKDIGQTDGKLSIQIIMSDERGMTSPSVLAYLDHRLKELSLVSESVIKSDSHFFGNVPVFLFFGDLWQLGPIGLTEKDLFKQPSPSASPSNIAGHAIYRSFNDIYTLDEILRQKPDQQKLLKRLGRIRKGQITKDDWHDINSRALSNLTRDEVDNFSHNNVLYLTETWQIANEYNTKTFIKIDKPVARVQSTGRGRTHVLNPHTQIGQIPLTSLFSPGCRVILSKNQNSLTQYGLNNGAMGNVIAILYNEDEKPPLPPHSVIVDFPKYHGPSFFTKHPTWVPIIQNEGRCESNCCYRKGFPILPGYALTIPKCQGMTIGESQPCTNMVVNLTESTFQEKRGLGQAYTAFSRCSKDSEWAIGQQISWERLEVINNHPDIQLRTAEDQRLSTKAKEIFEKSPVSIGDYLQLITEIDQLANDNITDAMCSNLFNCNCCFHFQNN